MKKFILICLSIFISLFSNIASAKQGTLEQCQYFKDKITNYEKLRRKGGSGNQMDSWRKKIHDYQDMMRDYNCNKYRNKLK